MAIGRNLKSRGRSVWRVAAQWDGGPAQIEGCGRKTLYEVSDEKVFPPPPTFRNPIRVHSQLKSFCKWEAGDWTQLASGSSECEVGTAHSKSNTCFIALFYMEDSEKIKPFDSFVIAVYQIALWVQIVKNLCMYFSPPTFQELARWFFFLKGNILQIMWSTYFKKVR